jgi:SAM-dependent methyltransferase
LQIDCENERELIKQLYDVSKNAGPFFMRPLIVATRVLARRNYAKVDIVEPSLEIGVGRGMTARFVLSNRQINVGSDLFIHDLIEAKRNGAPYDRLMAFDMMNIPFLNDTFGSVFSIHTIYHAEDKITAIREMARVLAPGGTL